MNPSSMSPAMTLMFVAHGTYCNNQKLFEPKVFTFVLAQDKSDESSFCIQYLVNGRPQEELLDDTGYLGAQILTSYLLLSDATPRISAADKKEHFRTLNHRLEKFRKILLAAGFKADSKIIQNVFNLRIVLDQAVVSKDLLEHAWEELESSLVKSKLQLAARTRGEDGAWSSIEKKLVEIELPFYKVPSIDPVEITPKSV